MIEYDEAEDGLDGHGSVGAVEPGGGQLAYQHPPGGLEQRCRPALAVDDRHQVRLSQQRLAQ